MPTETMSITTAAGHELSGSLELPTGLVRGAALFAHCFTCTQHSKAAVEVTRALAHEGIATLRFDFTGLGGSGGDFGAQGSPAMSRIWSPPPRRCARGLAMGCC